MKFTNNNPTPSIGPNSKKGALAAVIIGALFILIGAGLVGIDFLYRYHGTITTATVYRSELGGGRKIYYEFTTGSGEAVKGTETRRNDAEGSVLPVEYVSAMPSFNRMSGIHDRDRLFYFLPLVLGILLVLGGRSKLRQ